MIYTYDADTDVLYVLLVDDGDAAIDRTEELGPNLHVDLDADGGVVGVEFLYPARRGSTLSPCGPATGSIYGSPSGSPPEAVTTPRSVASPLSVSGRWIRASSGDLSSDRPSVPFHDERPVVEPVRGVPGNDRRDLAGARLDEVHPRVRADRDTGPVGRPDGVTEVEHEVTDERPCIAPVGVREHDVVRDPPRIAAIDACGQRIEEHQPSPSGEYVPHMAWRRSSTGSSPPEVGTVHRPTRARRVSVNRISFPSGPNRGIALGVPTGATLADTRYPGPSTRIFWLRGMFESML